MCRTISLTVIAVSSSETQRVSCALATWSRSIDDETSSIASSRLCSDFRNLLKRWWNAANKYPSRFAIDRPFSRFLWRALATDFSTDSQTSAARASVSASEFLLRSSSLACAKTRGHAARAAASNVSSTARGYCPLPQCSGGVPIRHTDLVSPSGPSSRLRPVGMGIKSVARC